MKRRFRSQRGVASKSDSVIMGPHICSGVTSSLHSPISYLDWFATQSQERALYPRFAKAVQDRTSGRRIPQQGGHIAQHAGSWDIGRPRPPPRGIDRSGPALAMRPIRGGQLHRAEPRRKVMPYPRAHVPCTRKIFPRLRVYAKITMHVQLRARVGVGPAARMC